MDIDDLTIPCHACGDEITYTKQEYMPKGVKYFTDCLDHMDEDQLRKEAKRLRGILSGIVKTADEALKKFGGSL